MDNHTPEQRRKNMQAVKNKDSQIEYYSCNRNDGEIYVGVL